MMMRIHRALAPQAHLTLRAHHPAPARVELAFRSPLARLYRTLGWLALCWGSIPFLLWVPPHYPWVTGAFLAGVYLGFRSWTGRYSIQSFAGICPRCGSSLSLGRQRTIDLPHTLTCFNCHFEPRLEVYFTAGRHEPGRTLEHQSPNCVGVWEIRWLADEQFLYCGSCHAGSPADPKLQRQAELENEVATLLDRLADEGKPLI